MGEEIVSLEEIHYEFWNKFVNKVFNDSEFKNNFNYRMPLNKSYYDLFWGNKDIHLCLRHIYLFFGFQYLLDTRSLLLN